MGQSRVQLGQFEAPLSSGVKVPANDGFVQEPFRFAVVIWAVHPLSLVIVRVVPGQGYEEYVELNAIQQAAVQARPLL